MKFALEQWDDIIDDLRGVFQNNYDEAELYADKIELKVNDAVYAELAKNGHLRIYTMRMHDNDPIVGYNVFFITPALHAMDNLFAQNDVLYIDPGYRQTHTVEWLKWCEEQLKLEGCSVIIHHMKPHKSFHSVMNQLGYDHAEHVYTKYLGV